MDRRRFEKMTFRCNFTRKCLITCALIAGLASIVITVIVTSVLLGNSKNNRVLETNKDLENGVKHPYPESWSPLTDFRDMHCMERKGDKKESELWPFQGPLVPDCEREFSIEAFDDEHAFNAARFEGNNNSNTPYLVIPTEKEVAQNGHYSGIRPIHYNLSINILNEHQFDGHVDLLFRVIERTNRLIIDVDLEALQVAGDEIILRRFCPEEGQIRRPIDLCIMKVIKLTKRQVLIIQTNAPIEAKERYVLSIGSFRGRPLTRPNDPTGKYQGSIGLRLADTEGESWALTTIFQMRYARTVFPCLDHPVMKARFTISIQRPVDTLSASNMPLDYSESMNGQDRWKDHFKPTPPLPPYVVTFSVMKGYEMFTNSGEKNATNIDLYYPLIGQKGEDTYSWIIDETYHIMERMEQAIGLEYGQEKVGFINVNPAPFWGIENYGLVTLESGFSRYPEIERGHTILVHEIVHQWLGDVITISSWDEICLQEGLTAYFEWKLSERLPTVQTTMQLQATRARAENMRKDELIGLPLIRLYNKTDDIAEVCFGKPPLIFHMIADAYGSTIWELFLTKLLSDHAYGNANFETWMSTISEITNSKDTGEFLRQWFTQPGHPILYVQVHRDDPTMISISQGLILNGEIIHSPDQSRFVPVKILTQTRLQESIFVNSSEYVAHLQEGTKWVLVDPDSVTFTRKVYTVSNYRFLLDCLPPANGPDVGLSPECAGASRERIHEAYDDFCFALFKNTFPWGSDQYQFDLGAWSGLFDQLHNATTMASGQRRLQVDRACECCFRTKEELDKEAAMSAWHPLACKRMWNEMCRNLNIMRLIGRDYTAPDKDKINEQRRSR